MTHIPWKRARRLLALNVTVIALVVIGLVVHAHVTGTSTHGYAIPKNLLADVRDAVNADPDQKGEGPVGGLDQAQYQERA